MLADTFGGTVALQSRPSVAALYDKLLAGSMSMDSSGAGGAAGGGRGGDVDSTSVSFVEFRDFCTLYGTFLGPVVVLQHACRLAFGGDAFWDALTARRQVCSVCACVLDSCSYLLLSLSDSHVALYPPALLPIFDSLHLFSLLPP